MSETWIDFSAGWCSGGAAIVVCQPVDTILTRYQAGNIKASNASLIRNNIYQKSNGPFLKQSPTISRVFFSQLSLHSMTSLWRGSSAMISAIPLQNALLMSGYGLGKRWSSEGGPYLGELTSIFIGGCTGGIIQSFLMSPVELIKIKQQVIGKSLSSAAYATVATNGAISFTGTWKGLGATILRDGIPHGIWFVAYDYTKNFLDKNQGEQRSDSSKFTNPLFSGAIAATVAWGVGYPADLIKTRIQAYNGSHLSILEATRQIIQESHARSPIQSLYRGFTLKLSRAVPASAIGFVVYENVKDALS